MKKGFNFVKVDSNVPVNEILLVSINGELPCGKLAFLDSSGVWRWYNGEEVRPIGVITHYRRLLE